MCTVDNALADWFRSIDPTVLPLSADEWAARERQDLWVPGAVLVVIHDGGAFSRYGSGEGWHQFQAHKGYWCEQITGWATSIYACPTHKETL